MFYAHLRRGALAGLVGGAAFGAFTAFVVNPLVAVAEHFEAGHAQGGSEAGPELAAATAKATSIGFGALWGLLLGVAVFGVAYFFLEPVLPGKRARSYVLGAAGFLTLSGAPWLVLPPQPPGVEAALPTDVRLPLYAGMVVAGALAAGAAVLAWNRLEGPSRALGVLVPFVALGVLALLAPANPVSGSAPAALVAAFRGVVVAGQLALWGLMATVHARLTARSEAEASTEAVDADDLTPA